MNAVTLRIVSVCAFCLFCLCPPSLGQVPEVQVEAFLKAIGLRSTLEKEFEKTLARVSNQKLMEFTQGGTPAATSADWMQRYNTIRDIAMKKFDVVPLMRELHIPYYQQYYTELELSDLASYHSKMRDALRAGVPREQMVQQATAFGKTPAGKKYLELRKEEELLWRVTRDRIEEIANQSAQEAFTR